MASWLVRSSSDRAVWVRALAEDTVLRSWARHLTVTVPFSIQEYTWVPANCWGKLTNCGGVACNGLASRLRGVEILLAASCYRTMSQPPSFSKIFLVTLMTKLAFSQHHLLGISQGNNTSRESRVARELKGAEILHTALEEFENGALLLWFNLPSTEMRLIRLKNMLFSNNFHGNHYPSFR